MQGTEVVLHIMCAAAKVHMNGFEVCRAAAAYYIQTKAHFVHQRRLNSIGKAAVTES